MKKLQDCINHFFSIGPETPDIVAETYVSANETDKDAILKDNFKTAVAATLFEYADTFDLFANPMEIPEEIILSETVDIKDSETIKNKTSYYLADMKELYVGELVLELSLAFFNREDYNYSEYSLSEILNEFLAWSDNYYESWKTTIDTREKFIELLKRENAAFDTISKEYITKF